MKRTVTQSRKQKQHFIAALRWRIKTDAFSFSPAYTLVRCAPCYMHMPAVVIFNVSSKASIRNPTNLAKFSADHCRWSHVEDWARLSCQTSSLLSDIQLLADEQIKNMVLQNILNSVPCLYSYFQWYWVVIRFTKKRPWKKLSRSFQKSCVKLSLAHTIAVCSP